MDVTGSAAQQVTTGGSKSSLENNNVFGTEPKVYSGLPCMLYLRCTAAQSVGHGEEWLLGMLALVCQSTCVALRIIWLKGIGLCPMLVNHSEVICILTSRENGARN